MALIVNLYPLAFVIAGERPLSWGDIVFTIITVAVIVSIWTQLSPRNTSTPAR
ncbi:MAG: hypothetical protein M3365_11510 [Gemmatimonadota bacterium]|nr:hypothetical protein [Gemmatimonadota bacterium]